MPRLLPPVDDDVFEALQAMAEPLVDDVNSVLRRLLRLDQAAPAAAMTAASSVSRVEAPAPKKEVASKPRKSNGSARRKEKKARAPRGTLLPEREYEIPMLTVLDQAGGRAPATEVIERVGEILGDRLGDAERAVLGSGLVRWKNRAQFVRLALIKTGDMTKDSPRGIWEITDQGRSRLAASK